MNFIKKIFKKDIDEEVHRQFQKFGRGEFKNRALINVSHTKDKCNIVTGPEFANEMVLYVAKKLGDKKTKVTGAIISTLDLTGEIEFKDKKQFQGVKRYIIDKEMSGDDIVNLINKFPKNFFAFSFEVNGTKLKIKPKAPKSQKAQQSNTDKKTKPDFCRLITNDSEIGESFVFEKPDFKKAEISHDFIIEKIEIPEELKNSNDFAKIRELSKRVGKVIRKANIDGEEITSKKDKPVHHGLKIEDLASERHPKQR